MSINYVCIYSNLYDVAYGFPARIMPQLVDRVSVFPSASRQYCLRPFVAWKLILQASIVQSKCKYLCCRHVNRML